MTQFNKTDITTRKTDYFHWKAAGLFVESQAQRQASETTFESLLLKPSRVWTLNENQSQNKRRNSS